MHLCYQSICFLQYPDAPGMHNMQMPVRPSFCERIRKSLVAIFVGLILISVGCGVLFWNEVNKDRFGSIKFYQDLMVR